MILIVKFLTKRDLNYEYILAAVSYASEINIKRIIYVHGTQIAVFQKTLSTSPCN